MGRPAKDLSGKRFGRAIAVKATEERVRKYVVWLCKCDCGSTFKTASVNLIRGGTNSCGCLRADLDEKLSRDMKKKKGHAALTMVLKYYKRNASNRGIKWSLTREQFSNLIFENCYYCGEPPNNTTNYKNRNGQITYTGVDRVENHIGYEIGNCVPCCKRCNWVKGDSEAEELYLIYKGIIKHRKEKSD